MREALLKQTPPPTLPPSPAPTEELLSGDLPIGQPNPKFRLLSAWARNTWQHQGLLGFAVPYPFSGPWMLGITIAKHPADVKALVSKTCDSNTLISSLLLGSAYSTIGSSLGFAEDSALSNAIEILGFTTTMACVLSMLFNVFLSQVVKTA